MINRIKKNLYYKHIGLIFKIQSNKDIVLDFNSDKFDYGICQDVSEIASFYQEVGYSHISKEIVNSYIKNNVRFFVMRVDSNIVAINGIFTDEVLPISFSFYTILKKRCSKIIMESNSVYSGLVVVSPKYRGRHLYEKLVTYILYILSKEKIDNIVLTTGASNNSMIRATQRIGGKLIGITEIKQILRYIIIRNEFFIDEKEKVWDCI